jgi:arylsulfatase
MSVESPTPSSDGAPRDREARSPQTARRRRWRLALLAAASGALAAAGVANWPGRSGPACRGCNVVLITIDTLRADHVGLYGYARPTTPNLDRFFGDATLFENAFTPSPCTVPAVLQTLTGSYDAQPRRKRLAEHLAAHGYATSAIVSQHFFGSREEPGAAYARGFRDFDVQPAEQRNQYGMTTRRAEQVADQAVRWLEGNARREPFLLWLHFFDPHDPYAPPAAFRGFADARGAYPDGDRRPALKAAQQLDRDGVRYRGLSEELRRMKGPSWRVYGHVFGEPERAQFVGLYDGEIQYVDAELGRVLRRLEQLGLVDRTLVLLSSDHGEQLGEIGAWDHCLSLQEREIRVPLLVRVRGGRLGGRGRVSAPVSLLDLFPTVLAQLGLDAEPLDLAGIDLAAASESRHVFAFWGSLAVARGKDWKLYRDGSGRRLYHVSEDPDEARDRLAERRDLDARLLKALTGALQEQQGMGKTYQRAMEELKAVGYID